MPKLGDIVTLNMVHMNDNEPCAGIVTSVAADDVISATAFPAGSPPVFLNGVVKATDDNEGFISYGEAPVAEPEPVIPPEQNAAPIS